ncbi:MAG: prepilin-type N-terminal cleavage/methylation domain-containing protein [Candidatus Omnitrophica bacterium]|nr:prepilin-type N-terminal cleavage/methylation domain-containing protein [Candidatus Omnitrophota bacterium]
MFKRGTTLIEVLISIAIFVLIAAAILGVLNAADRIWYEDMAYAQLQQTVRYVIDAMSREIRQGDPDTIVLDAALSGAKITFNVQGSTNPISYYLETVNGVTRTVREHPAGTKRYLTNDINNLCFCWNAATDSCSVACTNVLNVRVAASRTARQRVLQFDLLEKVRLRND